MKTLAVPDCILFDLDGTLLDTAPDLVAAAQRLALKRGVAAFDFNHLRSYATGGAASLIRAALNIDTSHPEFDSLRQQFIADYAAHIADETTIYEGVIELFAALSQRQIKYGIVTNKNEFLTSHLLTKIALPTLACVVCGDTTTAAKPSPLPLLEAAVRAKVEPIKCWYVGDDPRDGLAAQAAKMPFIAVDYGYGTIAQEAASMRINNPLDILRWL